MVADEAAERAEEGAAAADCRGTGGERDLDLEEDLERDRDRIRDEGMIFNINAFSRSGVELDFMQGAGFT